MELLAGAGLMLPVGSLLMTRMHQERAAMTRGLLRMETSDQYREYVAQCYRLAASAKTEEHRKMLREIARAWERIAKETEQTEMQI